MQPLLVIFPCQPFLLARGSFLSFPLMHFINAHFNCALPFSFFSSRVSFYFPTSFPLQHFSILFYFQSIHFFSNFFLKCFQSVFFSFIYPTPFLSFPLSFPIYFPFQLTCHFPIVSSIPVCHVNLYALIVH